MVSGVFKNKENIKSILTSHGYTFIDHENYISCSANFRGVNDTSSVVIYHKDDKVIDFAGGFKGNINQFLQLVTNQINQESLSNYLKLNNVEFQEIETAPKIKQGKTFDKSLLSYIDVNNNDYFISRGISADTCKLFGTGWVGDVKGRMRFRQTIPIFNANNEIVGFTGRTLNKDNKIKWQHFGQTMEWVWPTHINDKYINKTKTVILVESPICVMRLFDCGIKNVLCLFGVELGYGVLNYLLRRNVEYIILALNNEPNNNSIGEKACHKAVSRLKRYFSMGSILMKLPKKKDFGEMTNEEIRIYKEELRLLLGDKYFCYE